jgi:chromosome segregation ATPase
MTMVTAGLISGGASLLGGLFGASSAKRRQRAAAKEKKRLEAKLTNLENNRQAVVNPYETVKDLSGMISNPYENLGVATQAARNQAEQADISLANTLDTLRATGASAGGATALAQAALQSKKGVSASIEQQEAQNEKLRAQGELAETKARMAEAQRIQTAEAAGKQFVFSAQENRENAQLDRVSAQLSGAQQREAQAASDKVGAITSAVGSIANVAGSYMSGKAQIDAAIAGKTGVNPYT